MSLIIIDFSKFKEEL